MSRKVESLRRLYKEKHRISLERLETLLLENEITQEEFDYITE